MLWIIIAVAAVLVCAAQCGLIYFHYRHKDLFKTKGLRSKKGTGGAEKENLKEIDSSSPPSPNGHGPNKEKLDVNQDPDFQVVYDAELTAEPSTIGHNGHTGNYVAVKNKDDTDRGPSPSDKLLELLQTRRTDGGDRVEAMRLIMDHLGDNKRYSVLFEPKNAKKLLKGFCIQIPETYNAINPVTATSMEFLPDIWWRVMGREPNIAIDALDDCFGALFAIYDDVTGIRGKDHENARKAISRIVDWIIKQNDPNCINQMTDILAQRVDIQNHRHPEVRWFAMEQLEKLMFPSNSMLVRKTSRADLSDGTKHLDRATARKSYGRRGTANRIWFDIAVGNREAPENGTKEHGEKHRKDVLLAINTMLSDPNPESREIALTLVDLLIKRNQDYLEQLNAKGQQEYMEYRTGSPVPTEERPEHEANFSMTVSMTLTDVGRDEEE